ncbi:DUF4292 domain-containing protein [Snuella sedimenti]|uniref:DUF4292 domain-containing protein n=1 Tax=Snuella sedimenti TaxID=2798802 RepID=A0A8J7LN04_9FLAO|nr:DUF4292 domain-containing protein [Snuella sedimenti]MBJ6368199.1 DUF4292 domain-containing protein [Snuella sedimenti]
MYTYRRSITILLLLLVFNCKSARTVRSGEANLKLSAKQLIKENLKQTPRFKTLAARVKVDVQDGDKEKGYTVNMRIEKDKKILLMSSPISFVKALITPDKVSFYNKLDNTYFEGDYSYLSKLLGTELDFEKVQNLLLGEALYHLKDETYKVSVDNNTYVLQPKQQRAVFELFLFLEPSYFKIKSQQLYQPQKFRYLQIDYLDYQKVAKQTLPQRIKVIAVEANEELIINLEYKGAALDVDLRFPFKIPSGYKEIAFE